MAFVLLYFVIFNPRGAMHCSAVHAVARYLAVCLSEFS